MQSETMSKAKSKAKSRKRFDVNGIIVASIFIVVGSILLWDTTNMLDADSYIFPRAVTLALIAFCILYIFIAIASSSGSSRKGDSYENAPGSNIRRVLLSLTMLIGTLLMPFIGFLISGIISFISIMLISMYDAWTLRLKLLLPLVGIVIVLGFYFLFSHLLLVPLPVGTVFE